MEPKKYPHVSHKAGEYPLFGKHDVLEALHLAEHAQEEAYFHKVNQALLAALRQQDAAELEQACGSMRRCAAHTVVSLFGKRLTTMSGCQSVHAVAAFGWTKVPWKS
jgi:hypothetical protein